MFPRRFGTGLAGGAFSKATIDVVWLKGTPVPGYPDFRQDTCGKLMKYQDYGTTGEYGWEIDHIRPVAKGGSDDLSNLQPLHWRNNRGKSDNYPNWECTLAA